MINNKNEVNFSGNNDRDLVRLIKSGDQRAFVRLYQQYHGALYCFLLKFLKSPDQVKDIVQDTFVTVWEKRASLNEDLNIKSYLFTIGKNLMLNVLKRASSEMLLSREIYLYTQKTQNYTEENVLSEEYARITQNAIGQLPPQRRTIFEKCRNEGKSYDEVADELQITKSTINGQMVKAIKSIKAYLHTHADITFAISMLAIL